MHNAGVSSDYYCALYTDAVDMSWRDWIGAVEHSVLRV